MKDVPNGNDESSNKEIIKIGKIKQFSFKPKSHYEIGEQLGMLDSLNWKTRRVHPPPANKKIAS